MVICGKILINRQIDVVKGMNLRG